MNFRIVHFLILLFCSIFTIAKNFHYYIIFLFYYKNSYGFVLVIMFLQIITETKFPTDPIRCKHYQYQPFAIFFRHKLRFTYLVCSYVPYILMLVNFCFTLLSHRCLISRKTDKKQKRFEK